LERVPDGREVARSNVVHDLKEVKPRTRESPYVKRVEETLFGELEEGHNRLPERNQFKPRAGPKLFAPLA
jgi:hypothetical protein